MVTERKDARRHLWPGRLRTMGSLKMALKTKGIFTMVLSHYQIEMEKRKKNKALMKAEKFPKYFCSVVGNSQIM